MEDYYQLLGTNKNATKEDIKKVYRNLAKQYHPDKNPSKEADEKMKKINEAYAVLSNDEKRKEYDTYGMTDFRRRYSDEDIYRGTNFEEFSDILGIDFFSRFFGGSIFDSFFGTPFETRRQTRKGRDLYMNLEVTLKEAAFGAKKKVSYSVNSECNECYGIGAKSGDYKTCNSCVGSGYRSQTIKRGDITQINRVPCSVCSGKGKIIDKYCPSCSGSGIISKMETLELNIPAGIKNGQKLRKEGLGEKISSGSPGDLYFLVNVLDDSRFVRVGDDLYTEQKVKFSQLINGVKIKIKNLDDKILQFNIPSNTQSNTKFRIKDKGIYHLHTNERGDLYVNVVVETPNLTSEEKKKLEDIIHEEFGDKF